MRVPLGVVGIIYRSALERDRRCGSAAHIKSSNAANFTRGLEPYVQQTLPRWCAGNTGQAAGGLRAGHDTCVPRWAVDHHA